MKNEDALDISTPRGRFVVRPYRPDDEPAVRRAWQAAFGQPLAREHWQWKYHAAPHGHCLLVCVDQEGEVAALYGGLRYPAFWDRETRYLCQMMDNLSVPSLRGVLGGRTGLFVRTASEYFRRASASGDCDWLYGLPGQRHFGLGVRLLGYRPLPGGMEYLQASVDQLRARQARAPLLRVAPQSFDVMQPLMGLCKRVARHGRILMQRDPAFVRWRFAEHPQHAYQAWACARTPFRRLWLAYVMLSRTDDTATIVDLVLSGDMRAATLLIARLGDALREQGVTKIQTWLPAASPESRLLQALGFQPRPEPLGIVPTVHPLSRSGEWDSAASRLYYTMADSDLL